MIPPIRMNAGRSLGPDPVNTRRRPRARGVLLPERVRRVAEQLFAADFSAVRIHEGSEAPRLRALAFTTGTQIYFAPGAYAPGTGRGLRLLGHELAHVIQQRTGRARNDRGYGVTVVRDPDLEREAERMGALLAAHVQATGAHAVVQRMVADTHRILIGIDGAVVDVEKNGESVTWAMEGSTVEPPIYIVSRRKDVYTLRYWDGAKAIKLSSSTEEVSRQEVAFALSLPSFQITLRGNLQALTPTKFTGFEDTGKGDGHFEKHGDEFKLGTKSEYIKEAKAFGEDPKGEYMDFTVGNSFVRCDLPEKEKRRVFAANGKQIRTFYIWSPKHSSDPFAYAIAFTVNLLSGTHEQWIEALKPHDVDLTDAFAERTWQ